MRFICVIQSPDGERQNVYGTVRVSQTFGGPVEGVYPPLVTGDGRAVMSLTFGSYEVEGSERPWLKTNDPEIED